MALLIEDGTIVVGANSFVTDTEYTNYATARGLTVGATSILREVELIQSMDYLFSREDDLQGERTEDTQENIYPRENVFIRDAEIANNVIPTELKNAQMEGGAAANSQSLLINEDSQNIESEKLDVLETSYFSGGSFTNVRLDRVLNYLKPLLKNTSNRLNRI